MAVMAEDTDGSVVRVQAQLDNARFLLLALKALQMSDDVVVVMSANGLQFIVEDAKSIQATVYITKSLFRKYSIKSVSLTEEEKNQEEGAISSANEVADDSEDVDLELAQRLDLSTLIDCLALQLGGAGAAAGAASTAPALLSAAGASLSASLGAVLCLEHESQGPLKLFIEEGGVVTEVRARGRHAYEKMDFNFGGDSNDIAGKVCVYFSMRGVMTFVCMMCVIAWLCKYLFKKVRLQVLFYGEPLKELLADLDHSSDFVELTLDQHRELVILQTRGPCGELEICAPATAGSEIVYSFDVWKPSGLVTARYRMALFRQVKGLLGATEDDDRFVVV